MDLFSRAKGSRRTSEVDFKDRYERLSCEYLLHRGLRLLQTNYSCGMGEIDLILLDKQQLVFVEVRYRKHNGYGGAAASVGRHKQRRLMLAAKHFLQNNKLGVHPETSCRFDVMCLSSNRHQSDGLDYEWLINAFCS